MKQIALVFVAWLVYTHVGAAQLVSAAPCVAGTLATYVALGAGGCTIGNNILANFAQGPALNGTINVPPASLKVLPYGGTSNPGIVFDGSITAASGQTFSTLIN